ncbi:MAG: hypothetical protein HYX72_10065 [Acidobacteria bacterium]|nr:hypothetical protein [Acidobacteriota bacterium]
MKHWRVWLLMAGIVILQFGCSKSNDDAAIKQAIEQHLAGRSGLNSSDMVMEVKKVDVKGDNADADVLFRSRSDANATMDFHYKLRKEGSTWKVETPSAGSAPHAMPEGGPGDGSGAMPPGHPPAGEQPGAMPEGHPPTGEQQQQGTERK